MSSEHYCVARETIGFWHTKSVLFLFFKVWFFYRKYFNDHPESMAEAQTAGIALTFTYLVSLGQVMSY